MKIYESREDYLESILVLKTKNNRVRSIDIAYDLDVTKQSVHRAIQNLKSQEFIVVGPDGYIELTEKGYILATSVYERHLVLTDFFISIGVNSDQAMIDACKVEHDISAETFHAIKQIVKNKTK
jgi:Mn-dependent DtxR family transcriptional regulator